MVGYLLDFVEVRECRALCLLLPSLSYFHHNFQNWVSMEMQGAICMAATSQAIVSREIEETSSNWKIWEKERFPARAGRLRAQFRLWY